MTTADLTTITQLVLGERQARDRGWWGRMAASYWPDSHVVLSWYSGDGPGFVAASEAMSGRGDLSVHRLSPPVVRAVADRARAEVPAAIEVRATVDDVLVDLTSYTRISYRTERRDGDWRIVALDCVYERDTIAPVVPGTVRSLPADELARFRPSYAVLAWYLEHRGYSIGEDLLGDDRPAERDAHYARTFRWLHRTDPTTGRHEVDGAAGSCRPA